MAPIYRIAEDTLHLSDDVMDAFPDYPPWLQIKGFRNFVAHGYREVDRAIAWQVASADVPKLAQLLNVGSLIPSSSKRPLIVISPESSTLAATMLSYLS